MRYRFGAISLFEVLIVVAIISLLAALLTPTLIEARRKSKEVLCYGNLKQIHTAIALYQTEYGSGGDIGTPASIGLPPHPGVLFKLKKDGHPTLQCLGSPVLGVGKPVYFWMYSTDPSFTEPWTTFNAKNGSQTVIVMDANHSYHSKAITSPILRKKGFAITLGGSIKKASGTGSIFDLDFWHSR